jgi:conjugal transfer pilin signal peptidase TrbI
MKKNYQMQMKRTEKMNASLLLRAYEYIRPKIGQRAYARLVWTEVCKHPAVWTGVALFTLLGVIFGQFYSIAFNLTPSVPYKILLVVKSQPLPGTLKRNELVAWYWPGGMHYGEGALFVKFVKGLPGDHVVTRGADGRDYYVNGEYVGTAKSVSRYGDRLDANPAGVVPPGHYYLFAPHRDSLDSRYAVTGYVPHERLVGRAYVLY